MIPTSFKLAGIEVKVEKSDTLIKEKGIIGESIYTEQKIIIDTSHTPKESYEQTMYHELIHWIFFIMGEDKLRNNEKLVDMMGHLLCQYEKTKVFNEKLIEK